MTKQLEKMIRLNKQNRSEKMKTTISRSHFFNMLIFLLAILLFSFGCQESIDGNPSLDGDDQHTDGDLEEDDVSDGDLENDDESDGDLLDGDEENELNIDGDRQEGDSSDDDSVDGSIDGDIDFQSQMNRISAGETHTCGITDAGALKCWGENNSGKLGDGTSEDRNVPTDVVGLSSNVAAVSVASYRTCAVMTDGTVKCWGSNEFGCLGNGTEEGSKIPVNVVGLSTAVQYLITGSSFTCIVTTTGLLKCWGDKENFMEVVDHSEQDAYEPVDVFDFGGPLKDIATNGLGDGGSPHFCVVTQGGAVKCWGENYFGQLGNGHSIEDNPDEISTRYPSEMVDVIGLSSGVSIVGAGAEFTCALTEEGDAKCWGKNDHGQLGNPLDEQDDPKVVSNVPVDVLGLPAPAIDLSVGYYHSCVILDDGGVYCWGENQSGQLGDGTTVNRYEPVEVQGLSSKAIAISCGETHTCAIMENGEAKCWGSNGGWGSQGGDGQLGGGFTGFQELSPVDVVGLESKASMITTGRCFMDNSCSYAVTENGELVTWGFGGNVENWGEGKNHDTPVVVDGFTTDAKHVASGDEHVCVVMENGAIKCYGGNSEGQLGDGTTISKSTPTEVVDLGDEASLVTAGLRFSCAIVNGGAKCWGNRFALGTDQTTTNSSTPVDVVGLSSGVEFISSGYESCAILEGGSVKCWGKYYWMDWGSQLPDDLPGLDSSVISVSAGYGHTCVVTTAGSVKCRGENEDGQLGNGTTDGSVNLVDVSGLSSGVVSVSCGSSHTCAVTVTGSVKCWGLNRHGQLGDGTGENSTTPVDVVDIPSGVVSVAAGIDNSCALFESGDIKCWGNNTQGQLGNGERYKIIDVVGF